MQSVWHEADNEKSLHPAEKSSPQTEKKKTARGHNKSTALREKEREMCRDAEKNKSADLEKERRPVGLPAGAHIQGVSRGKRGSWWITVAHFSELSSRYDNTQRCLLPAHRREGGMRGNRRHTRTHVGQLIRSLKVIKIHEKKKPTIKKCEGSDNLPSPAESSSFFWHQ